MKTQQAVEHFGSVTKVSEVLGISHQAVYFWKGLVPKGKAALLVLESGNKLDLGKEDYVLGTNAKSKPADSPNRG